MQEGLWVRMEQYIPAAIMFSVTLSVTILFFLPMTMVSQKSAVLKFYWSGLWMFLALITAIAGGSNTLMLIGVDSYGAANVILTGVIAAFVFFVMFAWARLSAAAIFRFVNILRQSVTRSIATD